MSATSEAIINKVNQCMDHARTLYPACYFANPMVSFNLTGGVAGKAFGGNALRFNLQMAEMPNNHGFVDEVVPHEVAHIVHHQLWCKRLVSDRKPHGHTWRLICMQLGGNGKRCHKFETVPGRAPSKAKVLYLYNVNGTIIRVGSTCHKRIQQGYLYLTVGKEYVRASHYTGNWEV